LLVCIGYSFILTMLCIEVVGAGITGRYCHVVLIWNMQALLQWLYWPFLVLGIFMLPLQVMGTVVGTLVGQSVSVSRRTNTL